MTDLYGPVISSYSRAQALADGVLVDAGPLAKEAGFIIPVAISQRVWAEYITPDEKALAGGQSITGRLWDVLFMLHTASRRSQPSKGRVDFAVIFTLKGKQRETKLYATCGPGDDAEPVITIMHPDED